MTFADQIEKLNGLIDQFEALKANLLAPTRPANEVILDDVGLQLMLKVSKRTTATWREKGLITFSKPGGKIIYKLSEILAFIDRHEIPSVTKHLKIAL